MTLTNVPQYRLWWEEDGQTIACGLKRWSYPIAYEQGHPLLQKKWKTILIISHWIPISLLQTVTAAKITWSWVGQIVHDAKDNSSQTFPVLFHDALSYAAVSHNLDNHFLPIRFVSEPSPSKSSDSEWILSTNAKKDFMNWSPGIMKPPADKYRLTAKQARFITVLQYICTTFSPLV